MCARARARTPCRLMSAWWLPLDLAVRGVCVTMPTTKPDQVVAAKWWRRHLAQELAPRISRGVP